MTDALSPYDAVLLASYGGPYGPEDVLPFMRNATRGRGIPDERLKQVSEHYSLVGGRSPINDLNDQLAAAISDELAARGVARTVVIGNRNWHPFHAETAAELMAANHRRILAIPTSAYHCYSSCRQYGEDLETAQAATGGALQIERITPFAKTPAFIATQADSLTRALRTLRGQVPHGELRVCFVTHSIPTAMNATSGDGTSSASYVAQHEQVASQTAAQASAAFGEAINWDLTFCSRTGAPHIPWLEPDISEHIETLAAAGIAGVAAAPIGFICDHMEVIYDLDVAAKDAAAQLGIPFVRAATAHIDPRFVAMLVDELLLRAALARGEADAATRIRYESLATCCSQPVRPTQQPNHQLASEKVTHA